MRQIFTPDDARDFYDRFGAKQDLQAFYENRAIQEIIAHADFQHAHAVFELGFGTGKFARRLLEHYLPPGARYFGIDISSTMLGIAEERLRPWRNRVAITIGDATRRLNLPDMFFDRFIAIFVFDLLSPVDIRHALNEAYRILKPGGLLCVTSLTKGRSVWGSIITRVWEGLYRTNPRLVGGCRPIDLIEYLTAEQWSMIYHAVASSFGITSEVIVESRNA